jgi:nicotinamide-nucleotide amidase
MKAEIISIGTEILLGQTLDTNSSYLSRKLAEIGIDVHYHITAGDNKNRLCDSIKAALQRSDIAITTGGLGPTIDDITLNAIAEVAEKPLILKKEIIRLIEHHFKTRSIKMPKNNIKQAYVPKGAIWLKNLTGTAPGLIVEIYKKHLIALPGPPREMIPMFEKYIIPYLEKFRVKKSVILSRTLKTTGLSESQLHNKIAAFLRLSGSTTVGIYARPSQVDLKITAKAADPALAKKQIGIIEGKIRKKINKLIYGADDQKLEQVVAGLMGPSTISIAESCTGGLISSRLTDIPGISKNLLFSIIAYSDRSKKELLSISPGLLKRHGAVSTVIARHMADNIRRIAKSDIGISTTGIAGPAGATHKKPIGLVYIGLSTGKQTIVRKFNFTGSRDIIKFRTSQAALDMLRKFLLK